MRIVFFGTGDFSKTVLQALVNNNFEIVGVVSQPDKVNGRNGKVEYSAIKKFCIEKGVSLFQFAKLNKEGEEDLKSLNADVFVTASYGQIIRQNILDIPKLGTYNVHGSLLPKYRGAAPIQWAIMNGETETGITIMKTELGVDCGEMYLQRKIKILANDTSSSVFNKLATLGGECIVEFLNNFDLYKSKAVAQNEEEMTYYPMIKKEDYLLNFNMLAKDCVNKIRALEDCYFIYNGARYKVAEALKNDMVGEPNKILACSGKTGLIIGCLDTSVEIVTIQPEGKQKMQAKAYMNGNKFKLGDIIENS